MTQHAYLIALLPLLSFALIVFFLRWNEKVSAGFSIATILIGWVMSIVILFETIARHGESYEWRTLITSFSGLNFEIGILVDSITAIMLVVVTTVGACVQIYSLGYMKDDPRFSRFFAYLSLFLFSMLGSRAGQQLLHDLHLLGAGRRDLLPPDRLLVRKEERGRCRQEGVHHHPHRRSRLHHRPDADRHLLWHVQLP